MTDADALFGTYTTHCFWLRCAHTESGLGPDEVWEAMNRHYAEEHRADLDEFIAQVTP